MTVEEADDDESINYTLNSHTCQNSCHDLELFDIISALRGATTIDDEDDSDISESGSEGYDDNVIDEIQEIATALEHFASMLQKAHDLAVAVERGREKGRKRPKQYLRNLLRLPLLARVSTQ